MKQETITQKLQALLKAGPAQAAPIEKRLQRFVLEMTGQRVAFPQSYRLTNKEEAVELSFPQGSDEYANAYLHSYRLDLGVLHNPATDVRTTKPGVFWVVDAGLPVPAEKTRLNSHVFVRLLQEALRPPADIATIPLSAGWEKPVNAMVSAYLRPLVVPEGRDLRNRELRSEALILAPGGLVANADFAQRVFGNAGDPMTNDAAAELNWSGTTQCIIVAPHLCELKKVDLGLPHFKQASAAEREFGLCWKDEDELLNGGEQFHVTLRDAEGHIITIVPEYLGYTKKGVFMQLAYIANLFGVNSHHSGGALVYAPDSGRVVCVHGTCTPSGGGKSETANSPTTKVEGGREMARFGLHWMALKKNGLALKASIADDITAARLEVLEDGRTFELIGNVETGLFQRPDDAVHPGTDLATEREFARAREKQDLFCVNFQPLRRPEVERILASEDFARFDPEMQEHLKSAPGGGRTFTVCSAKLRDLGGGKITANPRYLQLPRIHAGMREVLERKRIVWGKPSTYPGDVVEVRGMRTNRGENFAGVPALCAHTLLHYYPPILALLHAMTPVTGKSPSTDGVMGNEGAVTRKPFQSLLPVHDVEAQYVTMLLTGTPVFTSISNVCGPYKIGQDFRQVAADIFAHMSTEERNPQFLIDNGYLLKMEDLNHMGDSIPASRLGYRITSKFVREFFSRVFEMEDLERVFFRDEEWLDLAKQDEVSFSESVLNLAAAQKAAVAPYYQDGSYKLACTPVQALLDIVMYGEWQGKGLDHPDVQEMFTRDYLLQHSEYYASRLETFQQREMKRLALILREGQLKENQVTVVKAELERVQSPEYRKSLVGTLGASPRLWF